MSSQSGSAVKEFRKRKHEGESKESTKKRKQQDNTNNNVEERSPKVDKKKKKGQEHISLDDGAMSSAVASTVNGDTESSSVSNSKRKKDTKRKDAEGHEEQSGITSQYEDEEMIDVPAPDERVEDANAEEEGPSNEQLQSDAETCFQTLRVSLYVPVPAIASQNQLSAILAIHLSPLLLSYFPPAGGVILSYHDPVLSAKPEPGPSRPLLPPTSGDIETTEELYSTIGEEFGASWLWLTVTLLVFKPEPGDRLQGWTNAMSEGFVGLVSYNYFQTSISRSRIPKSWTWDGPTRQRHKVRKTPKKGRLNDSDDPSQDTALDSQETLVACQDDAVDGTAGTFLDENGLQISDNLGFRVLDLEMIQAQDRGRRYALQLEGTLLGEEEEQQTRDEEKLKWESRKAKSRPRARASTPMMSGGLRSGSIASTP
ncbi:hypothetical protein LTR51_004660 [Lithohypha guttulata]|nr:hypothetical protein LTR51_004660 [Lithohypha guttulata]